jgi:cytochrome oxidase assembly protein ShyY1
MAEQDNKKNFLQYGITVFIGICILLAIIYIIFFENNNVDVVEMTKHINVGEVPF